MAQISLFISFSECGPPSFSMAGYTMIGGTYIVGSHVVYVRDSDNNQISIRCLDDGIWETPSFSFMGSYLLPTQSLLQSHILLPTSL